LLDIYDIDTPLFSLTDAPVHAYNARSRAVRLHSRSFYRGPWRGARGVGLSTGDSWTLTAADAVAPGPSWRACFMAHDAYVKQEPIQSETQWFADAVRRRTLIYRKAKNTHTQEMERSFVGKISRSHFVRSSLLTTSR